MHVIRWAASIPPDTLYLSAISVLELEAGTQRIVRRDPRQGAILRHWLDSQVLPGFAGRILSVDTSFPQPRFTPAHPRMSH